MRRLAAALAFVFLTGPSAAAFADAATTFNAKCAGCHGKDGKGKTKMGEKLAIRDLTDVKLQDSLTDKAIVKLLTEGAKDKATGKWRMPSFTGKLTDPEMAEQVQIVRAFRGK